MSCFRSLKAYRGVDFDGKTFIKILTPSRYPGLYQCFDISESCYIYLPCGKCIGCRMSASTHWAVRCMHEASLYDDNCFITLTFAPEFLDSSGSLNKEDFVKFMKRLRKMYGSSVRFFHCGEYGSKKDRPHHHALLFNFDFPDKVFEKKGIDGLPTYTSPSLTKLWPFGMHLIGSVTMASAKYVARYIFKKPVFPATSCEFKDNYGSRIPEYVTMSNRPGIGRAWLDKYIADVYPHDYVVVDKGFKVKPPRYYDKVYSLLNPDGYARIKRERESRAEVCALSDESTSSRLKVREEVLNLRLKKLIRGYEDV